MKWRTKEERLGIVLAAQAQLRDEPFTKSRIAIRMDVSAASLGRWLRAYKEYGAAGLENGKPTGRPRRHA